MGSLRQAALQGLKEAGHNKDFVVTRTVTSADGEKVSYSGKTSHPLEEQTHFAVAVQAGTLRDGKSNLPLEIACVKGSDLTPSTGNEVQRSIIRAMNSALGKEMLSPSDMPRVKQDDISTEQESALDLQKRVDFLKARLAEEENALLAQMDKETN